MNVVYPRTDMIGLAEIRTKSRYEEEEGIPLTASITSPNINLKFDATAKIQLWSENSYNNMPILNRSFWHDNIEDRKRTRGADVEYLLPGTGALNTLGFPNLSASQYQTQDGLEILFHERNEYFSVSSMDCNVNYSIPRYFPKLVISCSKEVYGELSPYSHFNLAYLNNYLPEQVANTTKTIPKLCFVQNNFIDINEYHRYTSDPQNFYNGYVLNKSYQTPIDCRIKPWYNDYEEYRENIKHKSQDMSIIPEFIVSKHENIIKQQAGSILYDRKFVDTGNSRAPRQLKNIPNYLTINGHERYEQIRQDDFKIDLKDFIDKKSNKIKFKIKGIKKLLPYNGFYPQERTVQIAGLFNQEYLNDTGYSKDVDKLDVDYGMFTSPGDMFGVTDEKLLSVTKALVINQPFFSPGILFNTIKSGISVPWKTCATSSLSELRMPKYDIFEVEKDNDLSTNSYYAISINYVFPFQSLLNPEKFFINSYNLDAYLRYLNADLMPAPTFSIPYLDPTHHSNNSLYNFIDVNSSYKYCKALSVDNINEFFKKVNPILYKSSINNFLSETANFFLSQKNENNKINFLQSNSGPIQVISGSKYSMNLVLEARDGFSMFNKYNTTEYNFVPSASLFGPPVASGSDSENAHTSSAPYYPYCPPYMYSNKDVYNFSYTADEDKTITIKELLSDISGSYDTFNSEAPNLKHRVTLKDCFYTNLIYSGSWVIQPKFEVPIFDFNGCSTIESGTLDFAMPGV